MGRRTKAAIEAERAEQVPNSKENYPVFERDADFQNAVNEAVARAIPGIVAQLSKARGTADRDDSTFAEGLAMAIAQLTDQGTGRKRVAPEIVEARAKARERMTGLIVEARAAGEIPSYQLRNKVYLDEVLVDPLYVDPATKNQKPTEIDWPGVPNEAMIPINDTAKEIHKAFIESIGSIAPEHQVAGKPFAVTAGGLVVKGGSSALRQVTAFREHENVASEGLRIRGREAPGKHKEIRVLGTVHEPARVGAV